jgi:hypothetical protein
MMSLEQLVDCFNAVIGATSIGKAQTFSRRLTRTVIASRGDAVAGDFSRDGGVAGLSAELNAQDPLILPTVLALSFPQAVYCTGRLKNAATYRKMGVLNAILTGFGMQLRDNQAGSCSFGFRNRFPVDSVWPTALATQMPTAAGIAAANVERQTIVRILSDCTFTPDGGSPVSLPGIAEVTLSGRAMLASAMSSPASLYEDAVDVLGWSIDGSITLLDQEIVSSLLLNATLQGQYRGTLAISCRPAGYSEAEVSDTVISIAGVGFFDNSDSLATKDDAGGTVGFDVLLNGLALGDVISLPA